MANSNKKGGRGERQACKLLGSFGYDYRRSQQYSGVRDDDTSADIIGDIPQIRFEVKYGYDRTHIYSKETQDWVETAREETPPGVAWAILRRKTGLKWTMIYEHNGIVVQTGDIEKAIHHLIKKYSRKNPTLFDKKN